MPSTSFLAGFGDGLGIFLWIFWILLIPASAFGVLYLLAKLNVSFTFVREGQQRAVMKGDSFDHLIMSYKGHHYKGEERKNHPYSAWSVNDWEKIREHPDLDEYGLIPLYTTNEHWAARLLREKLGIFWIGLWPIYKIYDYHRTWTSLVQAAPKDGMGVEPVLKTTDETHMKHELAQPDTYAFKIPSAETGGEKLSLDVTCIFQGEVMNAYKALFTLNKWLETAQNQMAGLLRPCIGRMSFEEIISLRESGKGNPDVQLDIQVNDVHKFMVGHGVNISQVRFFDANPSDKQSAEALEAQVAVFKAKQRAQADMIEGRGKASRARQFYGTVAKIPGGPGMFAAERLEGSNITAYAPSGQGRGLLPTFDVNNPQGSQDPREQSGGGSNQPRQRQGRRQS